MFVFTIGDVVAIVVVSIAAIAVIWELICGKKKKYAS